MDGREIKMFKMPEKNPDLPPAAPSKPPGQRLRPPKLQMSSAAVSAVTGNFDTAQTKLDPTATQLLGTLLETKTAKNPCILIQRLISCCDPRRGLIKAFVTKNKKFSSKAKTTVEKDYVIKLYRVTNQAHSNFQLPIDILVEDSRYPLTSYKRISHQEIKENAMFDRIFSCIS